MKFSSNKPSNSQYFRQIQLSIGMYANLIKPSHKYSENQSIILKNVNNILRKIINDKENHRNCIGPFYYLKKNLE